MQVRESGRGAAFCVSGPGRPVRLCAGGLAGIIRPKFVDIEKEMEDLIWKNGVTRRTAIAASVLACAGLALPTVGFKSAAEEDVETITFTDSVGREVEIPKNLEKIVPSGHTATQVLLTIAPEMMVSVSSELSDDVIKYFGLKDMSDLPVTGAAFGSKGDLNKETVASLGAQVLIDTGEAKDGIAEDLDALQEQLGIPCIFIETKLNDYVSAYTKLGELLGKQERAKELADYCGKAYDEVQAVMEEIGDNRITMAYIVGTEGVNAIAKGSYQGGVIDMVAENVVVVEKASGSGSGNTIDLEQLAIWDPEVLVFQNDDMYNTALEDESWKSLSAVQWNNVYECPSSPYCWLNSPPTINQIMGMQWLPRLLYPSAFTTSIADVAKSYYKTFYGYDLSDEELLEIAPHAGL